MFRVFISLLLIFSFHSLRSQNQIDFLTGKPSPNSEKTKIEPQQNKNTDWETLRKKLFFGGNFGMQFGAFTFLDVSPMIGYNISDKASVGVGYTFNYLRNRFTNTSLIIRGGRVFARYFIFPQLFAHGEYEALQGLYSSDRTKWFYTPLAGLGYRQKMGERVFFDLQALWNFNPNINSPYANPVIRAGIIF
jgi:hypothetical protein